MRSTEKNTQKLSCALAREANAKFGSSKRWKFNLNQIQDYMDYMGEEIGDYVDR